MNAEIGPAERAGRAIPAPHFPAAEQPRGNTGRSAAVGQVYAEVTPLITTALAHDGPGAAQVRARLTQMKDHRWAE
ncbi:hypothetical protein [Streptomyces sp. NPDC020917]|uniref:hypothetical protein n=1 Tax=Streptomyces sp. NPDC020917 TaxID=3365102 RepID=UPI00378A797F